ncbi:PKD domain-containing protein [Methanosarcina sp. MSH10X1]|nr:PKD domain-containing protein [Methanosarcina sp. MSH10X1]
MNIIVKSVIQWEFSSQEAVRGDILNVNGSASPGEKVHALVTFDKTIPVSNGKFEYILENVTIPEGLDNLFTVEASGVNNLNVRVKMVIWVTKSSVASGGNATVSQSNVPAGTYTIKIDGNATEGISDVNLKIKASQGLKADSNGNFTFSYNTEAVPAGNFEVKIGDITKEITLREPVLPVANFTVNMTEGVAPLSVQFIDLSENATEYYWDFGDGNNSTEASPFHEFTTPGIYTVNLIATNANGADSKLATINVTEKPVPAILPGCTNPPADHDYDGLFEDLNGNGIVDFDDVTVCYKNMNWIKENDLVAFFDYNRNSLIDFDDVITLYKTFEGVEI